MSNNQLAVFEKPAELMAFLNKGKAAVEMALPRHLNADRMLRLALTAFSTTPALRKCSGQSILASIVVASQLGLEPGVAGQAYLIPYGTTCTLVPGWQGLVGLLNNSGRATAWTGSVFEGDTFKCELGSKQVIEHIPGPNYGDQDKLTWVYAVGKVNGSEIPVIEAWPIARVWKHRDKYNKVGTRHYSYAHPEMYARKVVLLQVLKYLPRSIELSNAMTASEAAEMGNTSRVEDGMVIEVQTETQAIPTARVGATKPATTPTEEAAAEAKAKTEDNIPMDTKGEPKKEAAPPAGPSAEELRKSIITRLTSQNIGKTRLMSHLADKQIQLSGPFDKLNQAELQAIDDSLEQYLEEILNA